MMLDIQHINQLVPGINKGAMESLGQLLSILENLIEEAPSSDSPMQVLAQNLKRLTEDLILEQTPDNAQALSLLRQGIILAGELANGQVSQENWNKFQAMQMSLALTQGQSEARFEPQPHSAPALSEEDIRLARDFVNEAREHLEGIESATLALENSPNDPQLINAIFRPFHTIKGVSGFLNFRDINQLAHDLENVLDLLRQGQITTERHLVDLILDGMDLLKRMLDNVSQALNRRGMPTPLSLSEFQEQIAWALQRCRKKPSRLRLGEVVLYKNLVPPQHVAQALITQKTQHPDKPLGQVLILMGFLQPQELERALGVQQREQAPTDLHSRQVKVEADKIDHLMNSLDELVKLQSNLDGIASTKHGQLLQNALAAAMSMARMPIGPVFNKMNRLVRDLAHKQNKKARLLLKGQEVEVNRTLAESLYDPLVHMVRNSLDHGIEPPDDRRQNGKPAMGVITLEATLKENGLYIRVSDDGRGLDPAKIKTKLAKMNALPDAPLSNQQLFAFLFKAGFSTASQVTDVSGRGVGLDVVKQTVTRLGGQIEISSSPGQGATFEFYFANPQ